MLLPFMGMPLQEPRGSKLVYSPDQSSETSVYSKPYYPVTSPANSDLAQTGKYGMLFLQDVQVILS